MVETMLGSYVGSIQFSFYCYRVSFTKRLLTIQITLLHTLHIRSPWKWRKDQSMIAGIVDDYSESTSPPPPPLLHNSSPHPCMFDVCPSQVPCCLRFFHWINALTTLQLRWLERATRVQMKAETPHKKLKFLICMWLSWPPCLCRITIEL